MRYNFDFVKHRNQFFIVSIVLTIIGIVAVSLFGLHLGVDFKAGTTLDVTVGKTITPDEAAALFQQAGVVPANPPTIGGDNRDRVSARFDKVLTNEEKHSVVAIYSDKYGEGNVSFEENTVDAGMAREFGLRAIAVMLIASLGIIVYVIVRFEWRFAISAIIAQLHDVFFVITLFAIFRWEVNLPFIAALLTILGFSINDTIVIFDRIRENLRFSKARTFQELSELVNRSIWQTLTRSINVVATVLIAAVSLFIFGSEAIKLFSLAMIFGLLCGAYSSIFIASQIWVVLKHRSNQKAKALVAKEQT